MHQRHDHTDITTTTRNEHACMGMARAKLDVRRKAACFLAPLLTGLCSLSTGSYFSLVRPALLAKVLESAEPHTRVGPDDLFVARFASAAGLSLSSSIAVAVQLHRSPLMPLQDAALTFLTQSLAWSQLPALSQASLSEDVLRDLSYLVSSHPAFPLDQKQPILATLEKIVPTDAKTALNLREAGADLVGAVGAHTNATSSVALLMEDLGYSIASSVESCKDTLHPFELTESDVASILIMILRTQYARLHADVTEESPSPTTTVGKGGKKSKSPAPSPKDTAAGEGWQITHVIDAIKDLKPTGLNWKSILENEIDQARFFIEDERTFALYVDLYRYAMTGTISTQSNSAAPFHLPLEFMLREWKHTAGQLSLLRWALPSSLTVFSYLPPAGETPDAPTVMSLSSAGVPTSLGKDQLANGSRYQTWFSIDLLESLLESIPSRPTGGADAPNSASAQGLYASLRSLLSAAFVRSPDLLFSGLLSVRAKDQSATPPSERVALKEELVSCMLPAHLAIAPHPSVAQSFQKLWESSLPSGQLAASQPNAAKAAIFWVIKYWMSQSAPAPSTTAGLLPSMLSAIGYRLKSFLEQLHSSPSSDSQRLQQGAAGFNFDLYTTTGAGATGGNVAFNKWFATKYNTEMTSNASKELFLSVVFAYIKENLSDAAAAASNAIVPAEQPFRVSLKTIVIFFKPLLELEKAPPSLLHDLKNLSQLNIIGTVGSAVTTVANTIEAEAGSYFLRIYGGAMSVEAMIDLLLRFKSSSVDRDRKVFERMIHNLLDEYQYLSKYPQKQLQITGLLFGAVIQHKLVSEFTLGVALRLVLEALRKPADSRLFLFGVLAIQQFKASIAQWPQYAMLLLRIPQLQQSQADLAAFLASVVQTHQSQGTIDTAGGREVDFSTTGASAFGAGFHYDAQNFKLSDFAEAEQHALERSNTNETTAVTHLPPGLGLGAAKVSPPAGAAMIGAPGAQPTAGALGVVARTAPPATAATGGVPTGTSFGSTLNIDSLLSADGDAPLPLAPSESLKDKIHFIVNAVTKTNLRQKGRELKLILRSEYLPYFSRYLVIKRVSIEANFQRLYAAFLDYVGVAELRKIMLETTYYNIQVLLRNDKIVSSSSERSLLKNLGSWLGLLTIAKNKPIRAKYLDLKTLILEAYDTGRLIAVIPFCAKVLESCADSRVFKPPNPWLMAVVGLLREIFDLPGLKLNLKFEIEVLFNHLVINMKEVRSTNLLKHRPLHLRDVRMEREEKQRAGGAAAGAGQAAMATRPPFPLLPTPNPLPPLPKSGVPTLKSNSLGLGLTGGVGLARSPSPNIPEEEALRLGLNAATFGPPTGAGGAASVSGGGGAAGATAVPNSSVESLLIPSLSPYVVINPSIALFQMYPALKRCVPTAVDRAICEIINPVVERSLAIACVTSRELILKDFAMEPDEGKMRLASNSMVSNLTSSLALVTCREPLRVSITNHLNQLLEANTNPSDRQLVERACMQVSADNLELGTTLIEKAATKRAIREIDEQLAPVYQMRRKHRESTGQGYIDMSFFQPGNRYPAALPEALRAKPGAGLQPMQLRVYEDFKTIRSQHAAAAAAAPQTGSERPVMKDGATAGAAPGGAATLLRPEEEKKAALSASAFSAPRGVTTTGATQPPAAGPTATTHSPPLGAQQPQQQQQPQQSNLTAQQTLDKLLGYLATLEQAVLRFPNHKSIPLHSLTTAVAAGAAAGVAPTGQREDQEINVLMRLMAALLQQTSRDESNYPKDLVPLTFALKVFKRLYERENRSSLLQIDVHIGVLKTLKAVCPKLLPELTAWLLYAEDDRKFILPITAGLLRARLLSTAELDLFLSKLATQIFASGQAVATTTQPNPAAPVGTNATQQVQVLHPQFEFILTLVRRVVVKRPIVSVGELGQLLETLNKIGQQASQQRTKLLADHIAHLLEDVRTAALLAEKERAEQERQMRAGGAVDGADAKSLAGLDPSLAGLMPPISLLDPADEVDSLDRMPDEPESAGLRQSVMYLLDDWMSICLQQSQASDKAYSAYLNLLQQQRLLATPDATQKFFRVIIHLCIESALASVSTPTATGEPAGPMSYTAIDALAKLFVFLLKWTNLGGFSSDKFDAQTTGQPTPATQNTTASKIALLRSFLSAAVYVLRKDHTVKTAAGSTTAFNQRPYLRLFNNLLHDLNTPDPLLDSNNVEVLACFAQHFRFLRPQRCPAFLFAWLELIAHRMFMSKLLISKTAGCSVLFARLIVDLFRFLQPYLRQAELTEVLRLAYKGTLRLLLVLLHDFPEFLCEFHFSFCDVIPPSCIQMRNLILSAFPRSMRLPDPFTPNLKVDLLPEMTQSPRLSVDVSLLLQQPQHRHTLLLPLDHYLKHREPQPFFKQMIDALTIRSAVLHSPPLAGAPPPTAQQLEAAHTAAVKRAGTTLNVPLINAVVMYTGLAGINSLLANSGKSGLVSQFQDSASMDVYEALLAGLDAEGRYYVLNAIANQLRFPNSHTHYFSCVLLYLFLQCKDEVLMEQMTRVLLERLIVHRPHPWGLLITFIELIKNPRYDFWRQPFTRCAPEIERLFESVARSCMPVKQATGSAPQPGTNGAALGSSVGAGNSAAAQAMMIGDANHA